MNNPVEARGGEILLYEAPNGEVRVDVRLDHETVWLTQDQISQPFGRERSFITKHLSNVFSEGELSQESNVQNLHIAGSDKPVRFYNLDVIISVGSAGVAVRSPAFFGRAGFRPSQRGDCRFQAGADGAQRGHAVVR